MTKNNKLRILLLSGLVVGAAIYGVYRYQENQQQCLLQYHTTLTRLKNEVGMWQDRYDRVVQEKKERDKKDLELDKKIEELRDILKRHHLTMRSTRSDFSSFFFA